MTDFDNKVANFIDLFKDFTDKTPELFPSKETAYRLRAEFRIWHQNGDIFYAMHDKNKNIIFINDFPIANLNIQKAMPIIFDYLKKYPYLTNKLFQIEFLTSLTNQLLVSFIYHKNLDEKQFISQIKPLEKIINGFIIGRARKQKIVLSQSYITEKFTVKQKDYFYRQYEGGFSQPNGEICQKMLNWVTDKIYIQNNHDLVELYAGNGNFTLPLTRFFNKVLATELTKTNIKSLNENLLINNITNLKIARLSAEEFNSAYSKQRIFKRLVLNDINLDDYNFSSILVDPPRAGIDNQTLSLMQNFEQIIYISCNPYSLFDNLKTLIKTHTIKEIAVFDQFPQTNHLEAAMILTKK